MIKKGSAVWKGSLKEGAGTISTETGVLKNAPYGFKARFEDGPGTNPEELIAAAHAACFSMALSVGLGKAGFTADSIQTEAAVRLEKVGDGFAITHSDLVCVAKIPEHRRQDLPGDRRADQVRLPGVEGAEREDFVERQARRLKQRQARQVKTAPSSPAKLYLSRDDPRVRGSSPCARSGTLAG